MKIKIEDIRKELSQYNWKLLSDNYENLDTELTFECENGHRVFSSWKKIRTKRECPICAKNATIGQSDKIVPKKNGVYRVLALDQASRVTGYSIFDDGQLVKYGTFETNFDDEIKRDNMIKMWLMSMVQNWKPDCVGIEGIQYQDESASSGHMGITVFQTLARLQGILMEMCYENGIHYEICPTNTWRAANNVKGKTRNDKKRSMQLIVKEKYDIKVTDDIADAIGIGLYLSNGLVKKLKVESWET